MTLDLKKIQITPTGNEISVAINDYVELGVYSKDEKLVCLKKVKINSPHVTLKIAVPQKPAKIVLDPHLLLIDKNLADNETMLNN